PAAWSSRRCPVRSGLLAIVVEKHRNRWVPSGTMRSGFPSPLTSSMNGGNDKFAPGFRERGSLRETTDALPVPALLAGREGRHPQATDLLLQPVAVSVRCFLVVRSNVGLRASSCQPRLALYSLTESPSLHFTLNQHIHLLIKYQGNQPDEFSRPSSSNRVRPGGNDCAREPTSALNTLRSLTQRTVVAA